MIHIKIVRYGQALPLVGLLPTGEVLARLKEIEKEGYTERNISYAIWRAQDKINQFRGDHRFWSILTNEIRKHAFKKSEWADKEAAKERSKLFDHE